MNLQDKFLVVCVPLVILIVGYSLLAERDDSAISRLNSWKSTTLYKAVVFYPDDLPVAKQGELGAFHTCIQNYANLSERGITTPISDIKERLDIQLADRTVIHLAVNSTEAYRFYFYTYNEKAEIQNKTNQYAINCDIRLLDKPESDMHCEDKLIGNSIRPVCTYRPSAGGG